MEFGLNNDAVRQYQQAIPLQQAYRHATPVQSNYHIAAVTIICSVIVESTRERPVHTQRTVKCFKLRIEMRKGTENAQRDKPLDGHVGANPLVE